MNRFALLLALLFAGQAFGQVTTSERFGFRSATDPAYGATCGGSNNDSIGINAAIVAANAVGGGTVMLPACAAGYDIASHVNLLSNVTLDCNYATLRAGNSVTIANGLFALVSSQGARNHTLRNCVIDVSNNTWDGNGVAFGPTTPTAEVTHPMQGDTITGTGIPASTLIGNANPEAPFAVTLTDSTGALVNASASGTVTLTIKGLAYTGTTVSGSPFVTGITANTPNYMGWGGKIQNVTVIGNATVDSQYLVWLRMVQGVDVENLIVDGQVPYNATTGADDGALSPLTTNPLEDQDGIECYACRYVTIRGVKATRIANAAVAVVNVSDTTTPGFSNSDITISDVVASESSRCLWLQSAYGSTFGVRKLTNVTVNNVTCKNGFKQAVVFDHGQNTAAPDGTVVWENVALNNITADNTGLAFSSTIGSQVLTVSWPLPGSGTVVGRNVTLSNSTFRGGGIGASATGSRFGILGTSLIGGANGWTIRNTLFGDSAATFAGTGAANVAVYHSNDLTLDNVTIQNVRYRALSIYGSLRPVVRNLQLHNWDLAAAGQAGAYLLQRNPGSGNIVTTQAKVEGTSCYQGTQSGFCWNGDSTATRLDLSRTTCNAAAAGATICVNTSMYAAETGLTQTHGFGCYSPANGGASFTITNTKVYASSRVSVRQTAGTQYPFRVSAANGSFVLTPDSVFAGTSTYCWDIVN